MMDIIDSIQLWWHRRDFPEGYIILLVIIALISFFIYDMGTSDESFSGATVYDESFSPSTRSTSTGVAVTSKGVAPVVLNSGHSDEWSVIVKYKEGRFEKIRVDVSEYYSLKHGQSVTVRKLHGGITGINYLTMIKL